LEAFSFSVSHDLRAPLRGIAGFAGLLLEECKSGLTAKAQGHLERIQNGVLTMSGLIDALLKFSKMGRQALNRSEVDMTNLVRQVFEDLKQGVRGEQNIRFTLAELPRAYGDPAMLHQVWENLLSNAIKYSSRKASADIAIGVEPKSCEPFIGSKIKGRASICGMPTDFSEFSKDCITPMSLRERASGSRSLSALSTGTAAGSGRKAK